MNQKKNNNFNRKLSLLKIQILKLNLFVLNQIPTSQKINQKIPQKGNPDKVEKLLQKIKNKLGNLQLRLQK